MGQVTTPKEISDGEIGDFEVVFLPSYLLEILNKIRLGRGLCHRN